MKNKEPRNSKDQHHGYHELYWGRENVSIRANFKNDKPIGYGEYHHNKKTYFHIK